MAKRSFYIAAYDISHPRRLARALRILKGYAIGGQKSVFECFLTEAEHRRLLQEIAQVIDPEEDRFFLIRPHPRGPVYTLGMAVAPEDPKYFYQG
ncbi:MAG: CRISPR-associated endonuclease Cas2 [Gammaproteobacteria bacterium]|nr:MAG: CRISPR-associated endonuclease Cas2 [Gammaproteobacteria bacterium]